MTEETIDPPVDLWFTARGDGHPFVLLHPGGTDSRALDPVVEELSGRYRVLTPDQRAHGRTPDRDGPLSYTVMAQDTMLGGPARLLIVAVTSSPALLSAVDGMHRRTTKPATPPTSAPGGDGGAKPAPNGRPVQHPQG